MSDSNATYNMYRTPHGPLTIVATEKGITALYFEERPLDLELKPTQLTNQAANELIQYISMKRRAFSVPIDISPTLFAKSVLDQINTIPYGSCKTTKEIAASLHNPRAYRHVGKVVQAFDLAPLVPFHRIVYKGRYDKRSQIYRAFLKQEQLSIAQP